VRLRESVASLSVLPQEIESLRAQNKELQQKVTGYTNLEAAMHAQDVARHTMSEIICRQEQEKEKLNVELRTTKDQLYKLQVTFLQNNPTDVYIISYISECPLYMS